MTRKEILEKAMECVTGKREADHGKMEDNFAVIARLWTDYCGYSFSPTDVAMMMALLKIARIKCGGGSGDSFVDLCGYGACGGEIASREKANSSTDYDPERDGYMTREEIAALIAGE